MTHFLPAWIAEGCLSLSLACYGATILSHYRKHSPLLPPALYKTGTVFLFFALSILFIGFFNFESNIFIVAMHSHPTLHWVYRLAGLWSNHEGSMLLWVAMMGACGWVVLCQQSLPQDIRNHAATFVAMSLSGFLLYTIFMANPFTVFDTSPQEGMGLNPLLHDPSVAIHPPILYMGYVGSCIPWALAMAAMYQPSNSSHPPLPWNQLFLMWTFVPWVFLTLGVMLGSLWAYYELGWGGWWFWDPIENASLLPWLMMVLAIHAVRSAGPRLLSPLIVISCGGAFLLAIFGTFLARSGVVTSVHAFAQDPSRAWFLITLLIAHIMSSAYCFWIYRGFYHRPAHPPQDITIPTRDRWIIVAVWGMGLSLFLVMAGTVAPIIYGLGGYGELTIGPGYYHALVVPLGMAIGTVMAWMTVQRLKTIPYKLYVLLAIYSLFLFFYYIDLNIFTCVLSIGIGVWMIIGLIVHTKTTPVPKWSYTVAHGGIGLLMIIIPIESAFKTSTHQLMAPGDSLVIGNQKITFESIHQNQGPLFSEEKAIFAIYNAQGMKEGTLQGARRHYKKRDMWTTEVGLHVGILGDLYVILGHPVQQSKRWAWPVDIQYHPLALWLWISGVIIAIGGMIGVVHYGRKIKKL